MVKTIEGSLPIEKIRQQKGLIVELVGPAAAGKSTIYQALEKQTDWIIGEVAPPVWEISNALFYVKNLLSSIPMLLRLQGTKNRPLTRRDLAFIILLNGWQELLRKKMCQTNKVILLDQGPIFIMAYLYLHGPQSLHNSNVQGWWEKIYKQWPEYLDFVVYLDASTDILVKRNRNRTDHVIEHVYGKSDQEASDFIEGYRAVYEQIISKFLSNNQKMRIIRVDSGKNTINEIVGSIIEEFETAQ